MSFSVKTLFGILTASGVALFLLVAAPRYAAVPLLVLLHAGLAGLFLAGIVYGTGSVRAFCLGAMLPAGATIVAMTWMLFVFLSAGSNIKDFFKLSDAFHEVAFPLRVWSGGCWILEVVVGAGTVAARHTLLPTKRPDQ